MRSRSALAILAILAPTALSCALAVSFDSYTVDPEPESTRLYAASGTVKGLGGKRLGFIRWNGAVLTNVGDGPFAFPAFVADGVPWRIDVGGGQSGSRCTIAPSMGTIAARDVTGIVIECASTETQLTALSVRDSALELGSGATLVPPFEPSTLEYEVRPGYSSQVGIFVAPVDMLRVEAAALDPKASIAFSRKVAGRADLHEDFGADGGTTFELARGTNRIELVVTAADGLTMRRYSVVGIVGEP